MQDRPFPFARPVGSIAGMQTDPPALTLDERAFTTAVQRHRGELQRHCARVLGSHAEAEDAVQETLLRAWRGRRTLSSACPRAWLYRIATNACRDLLAPPGAWLSRIATTACCALLARRESTLALPEDDDAPGPVAAQPEAMVVDQEALELALLTAIQHLPPRQHASFVMRDVLKWSASEAAAALSTTVPATNSALQRARSGLRERLGPGRQEWTCPPPRAAQRLTLCRYLSAIQATRRETAHRLM